jgi:hypothetical protein
VVKRNLLGDVQFGYITWQRAYDALHEIVRTASTPYERAVIDDLIELLRKKGFEGFQTFENISRIAVEVAEIWKFDYTVSTGFSFIIEKNVERGLFYEFR